MTVPHARRTPETHRDSRAARPLGVATAALPLVAAALLLCGCGPAGTVSTPTATAASSTPTTSPTPTPTPADPDAGVTVSFGSLAVGDCITDTVGSVQNKPTTATVVPCSVSHTGEVSGFPTIPGGSYPDDETLYSQAYDLCISAFSSYEGAYVYDTQLNLSGFTPSQAQWAAGDHRATCVVFSMYGNLQGSVKGLGMGSPDVVAAQ